MDWTTSFPLTGSLVPVWVFAPALRLCPRVGVGGVTGGLIDEFRRVVGEVTGTGRELASLVSEATLSLEGLLG